MKVKILRAIFIDGKPKNVGETVDVPDQLGKELIYLGKVESVKSAPAEPEEKKPKK